MVINSSAVRWVLCGLLALTLAGCGSDKAQPAPSISSISVATDVLEGGTSLTIMGLTS